MEVATPFLILVVLKSYGGLWWDGWDGQYPLNISYYESTFSIQYLMKRVSQSSWLDTEHQPLPGNGHLDKTLIYELFCHNFGDKLVNLNERCWMVHDIFCHKSVKFGLTLICGRHQITTRFIFEILLYHYSSSIKSKGELKIFNNIQGKYILR